MPIKEPARGEKYEPTRGEIRVVLVLRASAGKGLSYSGLRKSTGLSDTALSKFLRRMQGHTLITRDESRRYHATVIGLLVLMSLNPTMITKDELRAQKRRDVTRLWREVHALQEKVLRLTWLPYADESSKLLFQSSGLGPDLVLIGALKSKDGKEILTFQGPGLKMLQRLGYTWK
jgi:DNA-binding HxlR family transcriptional regulator